MLARDFMLLGKAVKDPMMGPDDCGVALIPSMQIRSG